jgi:hypothetical protein
MLQKMAMGLEGYRFTAPPVLQSPVCFGKDAVTYENMPKGAEQRASVKRNAWVERHCGNVSETFSNMTITAADITSLLYLIEGDQSLVHAAYYTDDECIGRIAEWISGSPNSC